MDAHVVGAASTGASRARNHPPVLTIVLPTYNEASNIESVIERIGEALAGIAHEVIVVDDDSADGTAAAARRLAIARDNVRCLRRVGRRGLSGACLEGMMAANADTVAVMDADGQHDESILPTMLEDIRGGAQLVIGTRYAAEGSASDGFSARRARGSAITTWLARLVLGRDVSDPMSGFFMLRRDLADQLAGKVSSEGFKILFDILSRLPTNAVIAEVPFVFRRREHGESKLGALVLMQFLGLIASRLTGGVVPMQFALFAMVGLSGVAVHLAVLQVLTAWFDVAFIAAQTASTIVAMTSNFLLNNVFTYAHRRLRGWRFLTGLLSFYLLCGLGAIANVGVAAWIYEFNPSTLLAGLAGALMGSVFNYAVTRSVTWRDRQ
ncbi:MAG: glycosyltransferase [Rhizobiaceae bacterium]